MLELPRFLRGFLFCERICHVTVDGRIGQHRPPSFSGVFAEWTEWRCHADQVPLTHRPVRADHAEGRRRADQRRVGAQRLHYPSEELAVGGGRPSPAAALPLFSQPQPGSAIGGVSIMEHLLGSYGGALALF